MKNIKNKILIFGLSSVLLGCSQSATSVFDKDPLYAQNMQYTKIIKAVEKNNVDAIFNITYLNSVDSSKWDNDKQHFLIGSYSVDNNLSEYVLTMNGLPKISSQTISKEDQIYKDIPFKNHWGDYNIITFDDSDEKILTLMYRYNQDQNISTTFIKE